MLVLFELTFDSLDLYSLNNINYSTIDFTDTSKSLLLVQKGVKLLYSCSVLNKNKYTMDEANVVCGLM